MTGLGLFLRKICIILEKIYIRYTSVLLFSSNMKWGAKTFSQKKNDGAQTFSGEKNEGAATFLREKNEGAKTFFGAKKFQFPMLWARKFCTFPKTIFDHTPSFHFPDLPDTNLFALTH